MSPINFLKFEKTSLMPKIVQKVNFFFFNLPLYLYMPLVQPIMQMLKNHISMLQHIL